MADALPLSVRDLTVEGSRGRVILSVPSLDVAPGTALGIRGPSGAGKSTLLFAFAGLSERARGTVTWGNQEILSLSSDAKAAFRAARIGMIFQDFLLFDELDAISNAGLKSLFAPKPQRAALRDRAAAELTRLGLKTDKARNVASFSGGERQRVAVARAVSSEPPVILADEPTASLHRDAADALTDDLLADVADKGRTLIVVSHDQRLLGRMHRVIEIADGALQPEPA